jgi:diaminopropionate ammonia-lyase
MRAFQNPYRIPPVDPPGVGPAARDFHRSLPGYAATPLIRRPDLARALGLGDLYVKYEGPRFGLGAFKGLGASWALHRLQALRPSGLGTVSTASEGNHGRAVAWSARLAGIPCVIFLPSHAAPERIENIRREGARVVLVDGTYEDAVRRCAEESEREGWQIISDVGYEGYLEIPPLVVEGYATLYEEVDEALAAGSLARPDVVLIPGGVGGILHAGVDHYRRQRPVPALVAVEPSEGDCLTESIGSPGGGPAVSRGNRQTGMACLNCAEVSLPSWPPIRAGVDLFLAIDDAWAEEGVRRLHQAGPGGTVVDAGTSGAASTGGLIALMEAPELAEVRVRLGLGPSTVALTICTEGPIDRAAFESIIGAGA